MIENLEIDNEMITDLFGIFKNYYQQELKDAKSLLDMEQNLLSFVIKIGKEVEQKYFDELCQMEKERNEPVIQLGNKNFTKYDMREREIHGLFGKTKIKRWYYWHDGYNGEGYIPFDKQYGLEEGQTPGCGYFISKICGKNPYEESIEEFNTIFRAHGEDNISDTKAKRITGEIGKILEGIHQDEIGKVHNINKPESIKQFKVIEGKAAIMIDGTTIRHRKEVVEGLKGVKIREIEYKEAKIGCISKIEPANSSQTSDKENEVKCIETTYVAGHEDADAAFKRLYTEMERRGVNRKEIYKVFLGDGAVWIQERIPLLLEPGDKNYKFILDYYHAKDHLILTLNILYGEESREYKILSERWEQKMYAGKIEEVITSMKRLQKKFTRGKRLEVLQSNIEYFEKNKDKMRYDEYRKEGLPIGSGNVESACKHVIGGRLKGAGMAWVEPRSNWMLQIRCSLKNKNFLNDYARILEWRQRKAA